MKAKVIDLKKRRERKQAEEDKELFDTVTRHCLAYLEQSGEGPGTSMEVILDEREVEALAERMMKHPESEEGDPVYFREKARNWLTMFQLLDRCEEEARRQLAEEEAKEDQK